jgi:glycosyltransferase involved in cell wall biosynthesis
VASAGVLVIGTGGSGLDLLHVGSFSGSATSLRAALEQLEEVRTMDLMLLSRAPALLPARFSAVVEARRAGPAVPWSKTGAWSAAVQRHVMRRGFLTTARPTLVVQSLPAFVLDETIPYAVYTDRVGLEGASAGGAYASRFSRHWSSREREFLRRASRVFVMGQSTERVLIREYGLSPSAVRVVGAGPNSQLGRPRARTGCRRLVFVGTQWELKGGPVLIEAFRQLRATHPDLELVLVGSSPGGELPDGVVAAGRVPHREMGAIYDQADLLVIPTHMEAYGIALVEGLMKGLPCVCSDIGNQPWIVQDAGLAVPPGRVDLLVDALARAISSYPALHRRALSRGEELRRTMSWEQVAAAIVHELRGSPVDHANARAHE